MLALYRRLLALRRSEPALSTGDYGRVWGEGDVLAFERIDRESGRTFLVALNLGETSARITLNGGDSRIVFGTNSRRECERVSGELTLAANEGVLIRV